MQASWPGHWMRTHAALCVRSVGTRTAVAGQTARLQTRAWLIAPLRGVYGRSTGTPHPTLAVLPQVGPGEPQARQLGLPDPRHASGEGTQAGREGSFPLLTTSATACAAAPPARHLGAQLGAAGGQSSYPCRRGWSRGTRSLWASATCAATRQGLPAPGGPMRVLPGCPVSIPVLAMIGPPRWLPHSLVGSPARAAQVVGARPTALRALPAPPRRTWE